MAGVTADLTFNLDARLAGSAVGAASRAVNASIDRANQFIPGNAALGKADLMYTATRTLSASATEDLDLSGVLTDAFGATFTTTEVMAIVVEAASGNTNNVVVGGASSNHFVGPFGAAAHTLAVKPGQYLALIDNQGWAVTAGTGDLLKVANSSSGTPVTYTITVIGRSVSN